MTGSVAKRLDGVRAKLDELEEMEDDREAAARLARTELPWMVNRLERVLHSLDQGGVNRLLIAADELATCTNEQMLAERVRILAEDLGEALDLQESREWVL